MQHCGYNPEEKSIIFSEFVQQDPDLWPELLTQPQHKMKQ